MLKKSLAKSDRLITALIITAYLITYPLRPLCPSETPFINASLVTSKINIKNPRVAVTAVECERKKRRIRDMWFGFELAYATDSRGAMAFN